MRIDLVVGTRPNFVKAAPLWRALTTRPGEFDVRLIHTGQHYDLQMSDVFFRDLALPAPHVHLLNGNPRHPDQTAEIMIHYRRQLTADPAEVAFVLGDVNSAVACALIAIKRDVTVCHVEAGLRSFDRRMPEEINRVVTDHIADLLFAPSVDAEANLLREGTPPRQIFLVGNVMIDTLVAMAGAIDAAAPPIAGLDRGRYAVLTLHRPANVDEPQHLTAALAAVAALPRDLAVVFPVHPRTRAMLERGEPGAALARLSNLVLTEPLGYVQFLRLVRDAACVITDSGGLQEETTHLGIPCLTMRETTERPITIERGTNTLVGRDPARLTAAVRRALAGDLPRPRGIHLWDGQAAPRIVDVLRAFRRGEVVRRGGR